VHAKDGRLLVTHPDVAASMRQKLSTLLPKIQAELAEPAVICTPESTLASVMATMVDRRVHAAFLVNGANQPVRALSIRDFLAVLVREPAGLFPPEFHERLRHDAVDDGLKRQ
jgi:hypothetical protein